MKKIVMTLAVFLPGWTPPVETRATDVVVKTRTLERPDGRFELRVEIRRISRGACAGEAFECSYSVLRNDVALEPDSLAGGTVISCRYVPREAIEIETFGDIGEGRRKGLVWPGHLGLTHNASE